MPFGAQRGKPGAGRLSNASDSRHSPKEAKKKRLQDVGLARLQQAARGRGGECLSSECLGQAARYSFRCAAGHAWEVAGSDVLRGAWCRLCAHEQRGKQLLSPDGLGRLQQAAAARGGACLSDAYLGQGKTYRFRCMHGHEWETRGNPVLRGAWCPDCAYVEKGKRMVRPDGLARLQAVAVAKGGACLSTRAGAAKLNSPMRVETAPEGEDIACENWSKHEQKTPPHALGGIQGQGGAGRRSRRQDSGRAGAAA